MEQFNLENIIKESLLNEELYEDFQQFSEGGTPGIAHSVREMEKHSQMGALEELADGGGNDVIMKLIDIVGGVFRKAIKEFRNKGKVPDKDELIAYANAYYGKDVREMLDD